MAAEILTVEGPLDEERLGWAMELYGRADTKYRRHEIAEHLFVRSPAGPALHAFVVDDGRGVGHCCVVRLPARSGDAPMRSGKLEALFLDEAYRGRRGDAEPLVLTLLSRLYAFADERGIEVIHAYLTQRIGRISGFRPIEVGARTLVSYVSPDPHGSLTRRGTERVLGSVQRLARSTAGLGRPKPALRPATADDADLAAAPYPPAGSWTSVVEDAWDWYRSSPLVRVVELAGGNGCRALVQVPGKPGEPLRLIGWRPERQSVRPAQLLLAALGDLARRTTAGTIRFQPWASDASDGLKRACRLAGFVSRKELTMLWIRTHDPALAQPDRIVPTPLFYLGF